MSDFVQSRLGEEAALFQANLMIRACKSNDFEEAARIYGRFVETFDRVRHPDLSLKRVVKRLGREKARIVGVEQRVIDDAIRNWRKYSAENLTCPNAEELKC
ncbi:hypothetical protein KNJ79_05285 [Sphingopyxis indica]|uniref:hypothetical protein n=1 Tax=Sphingopyxis indica TaxID=436663 RepID=UPI0029392243|nr:hypothetical protein [Sphingopyxis indica]WOF44346.1 hypothetical protein KNJ79_05285 [Sphingopyxis indica]